MFVHAYNPSTWKDEAGGYRVKGSLGYTKQGFSNKQTNQQNKER